MRLSPGRLGFAGWLLVAAMLALSSPGVRVVRAQEAHVSPVAVTPAGPSCQQGELRDEARNHSALMALGRRVAARAPSQERVVVLGTEGRNELSDAHAAPIAPEPAEAPIR